MANRLLVIILAAAFGCAASASRADVWDLGADNDNGINSDTEITHGMSQNHDLGAQQGGTVEDVDFYRFQFPPRTSWEFVLDSMTGEVSNGGLSPAFDVVASDGIGVSVFGSPLSSFGVAQHVTTANFSGNEVHLYVRVGSPACALACTGTDEYRIRAYETTLSVPRYNNANGQVTFLILQNNSSVNVNLRVYAFGLGGNFLGDLGDETLAPYEVKSFNLATAAGGVINNTAGGLRIMHYAGYGQLTGKAVALEPATGFTFDTPVLQRPH